MTPSVGTAPNVGRRPTMPQNAAGTRTEPLVSVPSAPATIPAATAAAEPSPGRIRPGWWAMVVIALGARAFRAPPRPLHDLRGPRRRLPRIRPQLLDPQRTGLDLARVRPREDRAGLERDRVTGADGE